MIYNFDKVIERRGTNCFKWDFIKPIFGKDDLLPFWVADMDFQAPPEVMKALNDRVEHGVFGYPFRADDYYKSIINWYKIRHNSIIKKDWIVNTPGVVPGICFVIQMLTEQGDTIVTHSPVYDPFFHSIQDNDRVLKTSPLINNNGHFEMDFENMEDIFKAGAKMMILCSPHNPVGRVWTRNELSSLIDLCIKYKVYLISDEIHSDLIFPGEKHHILLDIDERISDQLIIFNAPSKTFNVAGLSTAFGIIPNDEIREKFVDFLNKNHLFIGNIFGITALEAAYNYGQEWLDELNRYLKDNYDFICKFLDDHIPAIKPSKQEGTYLLWLDYKSLGIKADTMKTILIDEAGLAITDGRQYGIEGDCFIRFNYGCPRKLIDTALKRFKLSLENRKLI